YNEGTGARETTIESELPDAIRYRQCSAVEIHGPLPIVIPGPIDSGVGGQRQVQIKGGRIAACSGAARPRDDDAGEELERIAAHGVACGRTKRQGIKRHSGFEIVAIGRPADPKEREIITGLRHNIAGPVFGGGPAIIGAGAIPPPRDASGYYGRRGENNIVAVPALIRDLKTNSVLCEPGAFGQTRETIGNGVTAVVAQNEKRRVEQRREAERDI